MSIGHKTATPAVEVAAGTAFALLVALAGASRAGRDEPDELGAALADVGDSEGESWLNLLGVPLDTGAPFTSERLVEAVESMDAVELRRHLLGRYAWSWCTLAGIDDIESAARGDGAAVARLLAQPRYYGGHAQALGALSRSTRPTRRSASPPRWSQERARFIRRPRASWTPRASRAASTLDTQPALLPSSSLRRDTATSRSPKQSASCSSPTSSRRRRSSSPSTARRVSSRTWPAPDRSNEERLLAFGRALADPKRVEILALVGRGVGRAAHLVDATGLTRSTCTTTSRSSATPGSSRSRATHAPTPTSRAERPPTRRPPLSRT